jgi:hypothetical protein
LFCSLSRCFSPLYVSPSLFSFSSVSFPPLWFSYFPLPFSSSFLLFSVFLSCFYRQRQPCAGNGRLVICM